MKKNIHNNIYTGILGFLVMCTFFIPISYSSTTQKVESTETTFTEGFTLTKAYAAPVVTPGAQSPGGVPTTAKGADANNTSLAGKIANAVFNTLGQVVLNLASIITYLGGSVLDLAIKHLVLGMGDIFKGNFGIAIDDLWKFIRDISNLAFIFGFIFAGIKMILDPESSSAKHAISKIIIGALLINFSLFFVKAIIDFSNFTAVQLFNAMADSDGSIAGSFADALGIITVFKVINTGFLATITNMASSSPSTWFYIMAAFFLIITGFVFAAAGIMIASRFVTLTFIMIFSPILFAATVFPKTEHYASDLWKKLLSSAFYVPVYLLLTFVVLKMVGTLHLGASTNWVDALANQKSDTNASAVFLQFGIIIFFMIQTLLIANKFSIIGGEMITAKTKSLIGASTAGLAARAGRATFGSIASKRSDNEDLKDTAAKGGFSGWSARQRLKAYRGVGDASFDARNTGVGKKAGVGEGRKGGYTTVKKEIEEKESKFAKSLGEVKDTDVLVEARKKEWEAAERSRKAETIKLREDMKRARNPADRARIQADIDKLEKDEKDLQIKYESEKQRRIIGSTYGASTPAIDAQKAAIKTKKDALKATWDAYVLLSDTDKELALAGIQTQKDDLKKDEDAYKKLLSEQKDRGYAGVLEKSSVITAWPAGRMVSHQQKAGDAIRKSAEKGLPKAKEG